MQLSHLVTSLVLCGLTTGNVIPAVRAPAPEPEAGALEERQLLNGVNCVVAGVLVLVQDLVGNQGATAYCQSILGYPTVTVSASSTTTTNVVTTAYVPIGTASARTVTANAVTATPVTTTLTASPVTITACASSRAVAKRQAISIGGNAGAAVTIGVPPGLLSLDLGSQTIVCQCLAPPTPTITSTAVQTATNFVTQTVSVSASSGSIIYVTSTVTPTVTTTYVPTSTVSRCATATTLDTSCGNVGLQWAVWSGIDDPAKLATTAPLSSGVESQALAASDYSGSCAGGSSTHNIYNAFLNCNYWSFMHRGFVYATQTGVYTFTVPAPIDDRMLVWIGNQAIVRENWNVGNAALVGVLSKGTPFSVSYPAVAGDFIPIRIHQYQVTGPWSFHFSITAPDGSVVLNGNQQSSALVQFGCGGATVPWHSWGSEVPGGN
ncbi:unnamed protein product [Discula destructiva]